MAKSKAQVIGAAKAYQTIPVTDLSGGIDLRTSPTLMEPNRARMLTNVSLQEPGAWKVRAGYQAFSTTSLGSGRIQGGVRAYLNTAIPSVTSTLFTLAGWGGGIYEVTDSGGWVSTVAALSGLSSGNELYFAHDRDLVAVFDGATQPWKSTNGSSWTHFGIAASSRASTASSGASGTMSASEFEFGFTYKARGLAVESNGSVGLSTVTLGATGSVTLNIPNSTDAQVDAIVVYARNKSAGESVRRKASSGAASSGASSTLVVTSSNWSLNDAEPNDHDVPPLLSFGVVWKNRWWARHATRSNRLHFTQLFQAQSWPTLYYIDIPFERGDAITAIVPIGDTLLVFGTTKLYVIFGQTSLDFEVRPALGAQEGALGPRAIEVVETGVVHAGAAGVYTYDGASDNLLSQDLDVAWRDLVSNANAGDLNKVDVVWHRREKELRIAVPRRYPSGDFGEWIMDLSRTQQEQRPAWAPTNRTIGGYIHWDGPETNAGNRGRLFSWHSSMAQLFEEAVGTTANGSNMTAEYEGPGLTLGVNRARWIDVRGEYEPHAGAFALETLIDGVSQGSQNVTIGSGLALYGTATYGTAAYAGAGRRMFHVTLPLGSEGRTFVQKATYVGKETFRWFSYHPGFVPETRPREFSE